MAFSDFIKKVKILLQGEPEGVEDYDDQDREPAGTTEKFYPGARYGGSDSESARLAQRMASEYYDDEDEPAGDGYDAYGDDYDRSEYDDEPVVRIYDPYDDEEQDDQDGFGEESDDPFEEQPKQQEFVPEDPLPTRTEVTLREIKRLSDKLDEETLRKYQMHLVKIKKETGAVSALTALRVLHEYIDDDDDDGFVSESGLPDLSAE